VLQVRKFFRKIDLTNNKDVVLVEAFFLGIFFACDSYLAVFLTRLGASTFQVTLLTSMPAVAGLLLTIPFGSFLINRPRIVDWYRLPRLTNTLAYMLTALVPFFLVSKDLSILAILVIWAAATLPQVILMITFSVVMNTVAGPDGRYDLMAQRWAVVVLPSAACVAAAGWFLGQVSFPLNYQLLFLICSVAGGAASIYFANLIKLPENTAPRARGMSYLDTLRGYASVLKNNHAFTSYVWIRFVFMLGWMTAAPLFPIYYVRAAHATDAWIGIINTVQLGVMVLGYFFWMRQARGRLSNRSILLWTTFILTLYPAMVALTQHVGLITAITGLAYFFQAGLDLVFFDEMMRLAPVEESIRYVSLTQNIQYVATISGPLLGSFLTAQVGLSGALLIGAALRGLGFLLIFLMPRPAPAALQSVQ
jgi:hypothetical protein